MKTAIRVVVVAALVVSGCWAQQARLASEPATGRYLVASRDLLDPNFIQTVILLVHHDEEGSMGLVVNRPARVRVTEVFDDIKVAEANNGPVYLGGPVSPGGVLALLRARGKEEGAEDVVGDLHLVSSAKLLEETLAKGTDPKSLRVFAGYAGWGAGQLESEMALGSWYVLEGDVGIAFDRSPSTLWERLIRKTEMRYAMLNREGGR